MTDTDVKMMMQRRPAGLAWPFAFAVVLHVLFPLVAFVLLQFFPVTMMPEIAGSDAPIQAFMVNNYKPTVAQNIQDDTKLLKELEKAQQKLINDQKKMQAEKDQEEIKKQIKIAENKVIKEKKIIEKEIKDNEAKEARLLAAEQKKVQQEEIKEEQERMRKELKAADAKLKAEKKRDKIKEEKIKLAANAQKENEMDQEESVIRGAKTNALSSERDRYHAAIRSAIESNWVAPANIQAGAKCEISLKQTKNGTIVNYNIGSCSASADAGFRNSVQDAVARTSKLPEAPHPEVWSQNFQLVFDPKKN